MIRLRKLLHEWFGGMNRDEELEQLRAMWKDYTDAREARSKYQELETRNKSVFWQAINASTHPEISPRVAMIRCADRCQVEKVKEDILKALGVVD